MEPIRRRRGWVTGVAAASLVVSGLGATGAAQAAPGDPSLAEKVDAEVDTQLAEQGRTDVWVRLADRADLSAAASVSDWNARGQAVVDALKKTAESSQKELRAELDDLGVEYEAFWATNSIRVGGADAELVASLASETAVEGIYPTMQIEIPELEEGPPQMAPAAVEWGIDDINAPDVWGDLGIRGEGIVVASIDTGVQYDHPALVNQYRGNNGDGTFDHNYNWFDAAGNSPNEPYDNNGHGSHVTGTMVGDDGGDNQIGVAPGATWIAANGCCPSDAALINSGQWMLEPRDLQGENPDVSKRPHIINNSWGTTVPSNDPFMEDIIIAWAASGQFGVFANGNSGPGCNTSGAPGSRIAAYSVGNYTSSHVIASSSGRGAGQDGEIKPNISAPGTAVRSSVPGNGYASYTGTSMASPHVAGTVALAWSGAPALAGDVEGTRALLDGTAIDTADAQCGGTEADNNVFGEGRLDARALLEAAPIGDTGTLEGTVTDGETGAPLTGVEVDVVGPVDRDLTTNDEGAYSALLSTGDYELTMSKFGYVTEEASATISAGATTTVDVALDPAASATVSGTVTDGSGYGFPLYARVAVQGTSVATFTDPVTGAYSLDLPQGETFTLVTQVQYPGYLSPTTEVTVDGDTTADVSVEVDAYACTAPGYGFVVDGVTESFDGTTLPEGWEVVDHAETGQVWLFDNPKGRQNLTGGEGNFAIMDSDHHGSSGVQDTSLVTPSVDMSELTTPVVGFKQDWYSLSTNADVDVSVDGGETWETVLAQTASSRGPDDRVVPLPMAAGEGDVKVRFHMYNSDYDWWWQVDDVFVGNRACLPQGEGGYVVGTVTSAETEEGIVGARVTNLDTEESAVTTATPADDNLGDGFYWMFSSTPGTHPFEVTARGYETLTQDVTVEHAAVVVADFALGSGLVVVDETGIEVYQPLGSTRAHRFWVSNTGSGAAEVQLTEQAGDFTILRADGTEEKVGAAAELEGAPLKSVKVPTSFAAGATGMAGFGAPDLVRAPSEAWETLPNYPRVVMDNRVVNLDGDWYSLGGTNGTASFPDSYRYDAAGQTWSSVAPLPEAASAIGAAAVDGRIVAHGGWVGSGVSSSTAVYDPAADAWSDGADAPAAVSAMGTAVLDGKVYSVGGCTTSSCTPMTDAVMAYDVAADAWETLADYPVGVAFASCGAVDGQVICTGGNPGTTGVTDTYAYDPAADTWTELADAPYGVWAASSAAANGKLVVIGGVQNDEVTNRTFAYDPASGEWENLPNATAAVYRGGAACGIVKVGGSSGGFTPVDATEQLPGYDDCGASATDVDWLDIDPAEFTLAPGERVRVTVTTDANVAQPGTYTAAVGVKANTAQRFDPIPVVMHVTPPNAWGKFQGTVSGTTCDGGTAGLGGAVVDLSPNNGEGAGYSLVTGADGSYAYWVNAGRYQTIAAKDGHRPQVDTVQITRGRITTKDWTLTRIGC
ncbi:hypothetical protein GCM10009584_05550 [Ornithinimicrobium humiphilum]|nr:S8 family serine peptidase [Ornithinimicrobium humiphilum]